ncbi:hypothetical protein M405DRAFT_814414 [Rhizopogon salebrosus TDB-379]|nr:hypothetical protein M405DRAFT_814414 [Rhizopogon salebrosus TDB-379]
MGSETYSCLMLQTTPSGVSTCSRHPNAPSLVLAAFQGVPITTKHTCPSSQPSGIMFQVPSTPSASVMPSKVGIATSICSSS